MSDNQHMSVAHVGSKFPHHSPWVVPDQKLLAVSWLEGDLQEELLLSIVALILGTEFLKLYTSQCDGCSNETCSGCCQQTHQAVDIRMSA
jgi:hypothetical protein